MTDLISARGVSVSAEGEKAPSGLAGVWPLLARDVRVATRSGGGWFNAVFFFAIFATFTAFAVGPDRADLAAAAPALLWLGAGLALQLAGADLFAPDYDDGSLRTIAAEQASLAPYLLGKYLVLFLSSAALIVCLAPLYYVVFAVPPDRVLVASGVFLAGAPVLAMAAGVAAAMSAGMRSSGLLGASLSAPATIPVLIFGVGATEKAVASGSLMSPELLILGALTLIYGVILPPFAIAALRFGLE